MLAQIGKKPTGKRLELIKKSPNYRNGRFQNIDDTPDLSEEFKPTKVLREFAFPSNKRVKPSFAIPSIYQDIKNIPNDSLVWFGHSSYLMNLEGVKILVDPVLSGNASPIPGMLCSFVGTDIYSVEDFPDIDILLITHDHYDHLDYKTIKKLKPKINRIICGLGVGEHFEYWGYKSGSITELDWYQSTTYRDGIKLTATPVRHFSGRSAKRNTSLFCSYVLKTSEQNIFIGGDSGYGTHHKTIGDQYGPFDFGLIECGQYNRMWKEIHALPHEWEQMVNDLRLKAVQPVHFGKFKLALHDWDEPIELFYNTFQDKSIELWTPRIGEIYSWKDKNNTSMWWKEEHKKL